MASLAYKYNVTAIATLGSDGFCGHDDHIITHEGALDAQERLASVGIDIPVLALRSDGQGELRLAVDAFRKARALGIHRSQMPVDATGTLDSRFLNEHPHYSTLFEYETFDIIPPRSIGTTAVRHAKAA